MTSYQTELPDAERYEVDYTSNIRRPGRFVRLIKITRSEESKAENKQERWVLEPRERDRASWS